MTSAGRHAPHYKYRPDIDGLRAIAVLSVVLFHAGMTWLSGGFVGVDIFFVISGYLITGILLGDSSIARFYIRRMRRILPALLSMLAVVTVAAVLLLLPADLASYGKSAASTVLFSSNLYFWRVMGYFQPGTQTMPLLHTWSLGVEEQYYILFPPLLILLRRFSDRAKGIVFALTGIVSLLIAIAAMRLQQGNGAFYLLPSRARHHPRRQRRPRQQFPRARITRRSGRWRGWRGWRSSSGRSWPIPARPRSPGWRRCPRCSARCC